MTRAAPQNSPVEAQATLPWPVAAPVARAPLAGAVPATGEPVPPVGWAWQSYRPGGSGWGVAVLAAAAGDRLVEVDAAGGAYLVRCWRRAGRAGPYRAPSESTRTANTFEGAIALAVESARC
jgi:hypothetical protein